MNFSKVKTKVRFRTEKGKAVFLKARKVDGLNGLTVCTNVCNKSISSVFGEDFSSASYDRNVPIGHIEEETIILFGVFHVDTVVNITFIRLFHVFQKTSCNLSNSVSASSGINRIFLKIYFDIAVPSKIDGRKGNV